MHILSQKSKVCSEMLAEAPELGDRDSLVNQQLPNETLRGLEVVVESVTWILYTKYIIIRFKASSLEEILVGKY